MSLTPEERRRIYEEEKARLEAQKELKEEKPPAPRKKGGGLLVGCLVVIGFLILLGILGSQSDIGKPTRSTAPSQTATTQEKPKPHLTIKVTKWQYNDFAHWIAAEGVVTNDGRVPVYSPTIIGEAYDKSGTLLGQDKAWPEGQFLSNMSPGTSAGFSMLIPVKGGTVAKAAVFTKDAEYDVTYPK